MSLPSSPRVVVTGAGSGLGRAFCQELAARGARILASDVDAGTLAETVAALPAGDYAQQTCDVGRLDQVEQLAVTAERRWGGVDLLINNAGVAVGGATGDIPIEDWRWIVDVNLWGPIHGCHVFVPRFRAQRSGHILNVASAAGLLCSPQMGPYNVTKAGVVALSETLYAELAPAGIGVSVLCPTFFQTNIARHAHMQGDPQLLGMVETLMERATVQARDVARAAIDAVVAGELYVVPHTDGLWLWRFKRLQPSWFHTLTPKLLALRSGWR